MGYMVNFIRFARMNDKFIKKYYRGKVFKLYKESNPHEGGIRISFTDLGNAISGLEPN